MILPMKRSLIPSVLWIGLSGFLAAAPVPFEIPSNLKSTAPEVASAENNLLRFGAILAADSTERRKQVREAREQTRRGESITDRDLLTHLRQRHEQASALLKPPLRFVPEMNMRSSIAF